MKQFHISRHIAASPERVWAVLTNSTLLSSGPLGITRLDGAIGPGQRLKLWTEATGTRAFGLEVSTFDRPSCMVWEGGMPLGLFRGVRTFRLTPSGSGVDFEMTERFSGPLSGLIGKSIPDLTPGFEKFATGLALLAEKETP